MQILEISTITEISIITKMYKNISWLSNYEKGHLKECNWIILYK